MFFPLFRRRRYEDICESKRLSDRGILVCFADEIDSTSSEMRRWAESGGEGTPVLMVAEKQTAGRGRLGRSFYSPSDTGIYMTLLLENGKDFRITTGLTPAAAVAVLRGTDRLTRKKTQIKWVNDILLDGKKIAGILAESFSVGEKQYVSIGIGVNVNTKDFPEDIQGIAGSIGKRVDRVKICESIACELYDLCRCASGGDRSYMKEYRERSAVLGKRVTFVKDSITSEGVATEIDDDGSLLVTLDNGETVTLSGGEITLRLK